MGREEVGENLERSQDGKCLILGKAFAKIPQPFASLPPISLNTYETQASLKSLMPGRGMTFLKWVLRTGPLPFPTELYNENKVKHPNGEQGDSFHI